MGKIFSWVIRNRLLSLLLILSPIIFTATKMDQIQFDTGFERLHTKNDPDNIFYKKVTKEFGGDDTILLYFEDSNLYQKENLKQIQGLVWKIQEMENIQKIDSIFTTPHFISKDGFLSTTPAFEDLPDEQLEINQIIAELKENPLVAGRLISNGPSKALLVNIQLSEEVTEKRILAQKVNTLLQENIKNIDVKFQTGNPSLDLFIFNEIGESQKTIVPIVFIVIFFLISLGTKSFHASLISAVVVFLNMFLTIGFMIFVGIPIQVMISSIPIIIYILTTTEITHLVTHYQELRNRGMNKVNSIVETGHEIGMAITLTAFTTACGFLVICFNEIIMLREFGLVCSFSLVMSYILTLVYTPLHLSIFSKSDSKEENIIFKKREGIKLLTSSLFQRAIKGKVFLFISIIYLIASSLYSLQVVTDNESINLLKKDTTPRRQIKVFEKSFSGINNLFLVLESDQDKAFKQPKNLDLIFKLQNKIEAMPEFEQADSFGRLMAHINREMRQDKKYYKTPESTNLISQYLLSLTRDDYEKYVSADFRRANISIRHSISSSTKLEAALKKLDMFLNDELKDTGIRHKMISEGTLNMKAGKTIVKSQTQSVIFMLVLISLVLGFLFKNLKFGLLAIPPNIMPILGFFGVLGYFDIPLNLGTCIVASITVGIAVDDTIHFFSRFKDNSKKSKNIAKVVSDSLHEETTPIIVTSLSLALGFSFLVFSKFVPLQQFGFLSSLVILLAMISDLLITPSILLLFGKEKASE